MEQNSQRDPKLTTCPRCTNGYQLNGSGSNRECDVCIAWGVDNDLGQAIYEQLHKRGADRMDTYVRSLFIQRKAIRREIRQLQARQRYFNRRFAPALQIAG